MANVNKTTKDRTVMMDTIRRSMGGSLVDIELDAEDYHLAIDKSIEQFRQQSENSTEEATLFLDINATQTEFVLPDEVIEVRQAYRRSTGTLGSGGTEIDPFELAYTNIYLLQAGSNSSGGIATYYFYTVYQEELGKLFGLYLNFNWEPYSKKLTLVRRGTGGETIGLWVHTEKPETAIFNDRYTGPWIRDWAIAECTEMLGKGYRKYSSIAGPNGATTLPGPEMVMEAKEMKTELRDRLRNYETGENPPWWVIG